MKYLHENVFQLWTIIHTEQFRERTHCLTQVKILCQDWFRWLLGASWYQAMTWTNFDPLSVTNLREIFQRNFIWNAHDDVIKWKHFPCYWPFVRGIHRSSVDFPHKGQRRGALKFSLICAWTNGWGNNRDACDLRRHRTHYNVTVMFHQRKYICKCHLPNVSHCIHTQCVQRCNKTVTRGTLRALWEPMMTSSNGNIFRVTGHLCGEFTGSRWIPRTKACDAELWCFLWSASE